MKKIVIVLITLFICLTLTGCSALGNDLKKSVDIIVEKVKSKKPAPNTEEMVTYLIEKAKIDSKLNDKSTFNFSLNYIKDHIGDINGDNTVMENLIYYGAILQYSPKDKYSSSYTTIGMKTVEAIKEAYTNKDKGISSNKLQVIKVLINRLETD